MDERATWFLRAIESGIAERRNDLLPVVLARVSPEYVIVSSGVHGLVAAILEHSDDKDRWDVRVEFLDQDQHTKCDVVVIARDNQDRYNFEFKALWPNGTKECVGGLKRDRAKLKGARNAYVVAFAYALSIAPKDASKRCRQFDATKFKTAEEALDSALAKAHDLHEGLGKSIFTSEAISIDGFETKGVARLVAWKVGTA